MACMRVFFPALSQFLSYFCVCWILSRELAPKLYFFSCSTQLSMKFVLLINLKIPTTANSFLINIAEHENSLRINMKMPTIVGIFILISRENFMLS